MFCLFSRKGRKRRKLEKAIEDLYCLIDRERTRVGCLQGVVKRHTEAGHKCHLTEGGFERIAHHKGNIHHYRFLIQEAKKQLEELGE